MRRRAGSQSSLGKVGLPGDVERADERAGKDLGIGGLWHALAGAVLLPPGFHLRQPRFHLWQRLRGLARMMSMRRASSSLPMT